MKAKGALVAAFALIGAPARAQGLPTATDAAFAYTDAVPKCDPGAPDCDWAMYGTPVRTVESLTCTWIGDDKARCRFTIDRKQAAVGWRRCRAVFVSRLSEGALVWRLARIKVGEDDRPQIECH